MAEFLMQYGLFLAKLATIVVAVAALIVLGVALTRREGSDEHLEVDHLNRQYESMTQALRKAILPKKDFKQQAKRLKSDRKRREQGKGGASPSPRRRLFVLEFHGDIKASGIASLREEITAILTLADPSDEVLLRLESAGGLVHGHGLAASQLMRVRERAIPLTVAVDKMAASGGYMMACVANRIVAAPFAVVGSIGVLAQLPNFHRLLDQHGIDFEQIQAGEFKRTLTLFGENTEGDRAKLRQEVEETHELFKRFIVDNRPGLDIGKVATGEHWYGSRALELGLIDELRTSDDLLLAASRDTDIYRIRYKAHKTLINKLLSAISARREGSVGALWRQLATPHET